VDLCGSVEFHWAGPSAAGDLLCKSTKRMRRSTNLPLKLSTVYDLEFPPDNVRILNEMPKTPLFGA